MTKSKLISSTIIAVIATILFALIHEYANIQLTKKITEDKAFDYLAKYYLADDNVPTNSPHVMVFGIDNFYFKSENLLDEDNQTNYGFLFPHDKIVKFIKKIDEIAKVKHPKALFIDYDFEFTSSVYGQELTKENLALMEMLKKERPYTILLPKTSKYNFVESSSDKIIQSLIRNKKIVFVSVPLPYSKDEITRRFVPFMPYKHSVTSQEHNYTSAYVAMWQMFNPESNITKDFKKQEVVENRILVKSYKPSLFVDKKYAYKQSNWEILDYYSANYPLERIKLDNFSNALIFLGRTDDADSFKVLTSKGKLSGVEVQANALMTLFYFDGTLKKVNIYKSLPFVFMVFFLTSLFVHKFLNLLPNQVRVFLVKRKISQITVAFALATVVMALVSVFVLLKYKQWFDWNSSLILFGSSLTVLMVIEFVTRFKINIKGFWMKVIIGLVLTVLLSVVFANSLLVEDGNVTVEIDSKEYNLTKNTTRELKAGAKVCVKEGNGTVLINSKVVLSKDLNNSCIELVKKKKFDFKEWFKKYKKVVFSLFSKAKEQTKLAVTRKGGEAETATGTISLKSSDEYLVIKNSTWSPYPIRLKVLDVNGDIVYEDIHEKGDVVLFIVSREFLKNGYRVLVSDGFGELVVDVKLENQ